MTTRHAKTHHAKREKHDPHPAPPLPPEEPPTAPAVDVRGVFGHILDALDHLAQQAGSPPGVTTALAAARELLGKES